MIFVHNRNRFNGLDGISIMRGSLLGNPATHLKGFTRAKIVVSTRAKSIEYFLGWLQEEWKKDGEVKRELLRLVQIAKHGDLHLVCCCKPLDCHGDTIKEVLEKLIAKGF